MALNHVHELEVPPSPDESVEHLLRPLLVGVVVLGDGRSRRRRGRRWRRRGRRRRGCGGRRGGRGSLPASAQALLAAAAASAIVGFEMLGESCEDDFVTFSGVVLVDIWQVYCRGGNTSWIGLKFYK